MINKLLESESEDDEGDHNKRKSTLSRLSQLSKLNLLGLIDLSLIAAELKLDKNIDRAIRHCEESIALLKILNRDASIDVGIASQNLIEDLYENLLRARDNQLEVVDEEDTPTQTRSASSPMKDTHEL